MNIRFTRLGALTGGGISVNLKICCLTARELVLICLLLYGIDYKRSPYSDLLRAVRPGDQIPVGGEIFRTRAERPWGLPNLLVNGLGGHLREQIGWGLALTTPPI